MEAIKPYLKAKKSLGQNFLTSIPARIKIVEAGHLKPNDTVLEIGPGRGFLTEELLSTGTKIIAVEKDNSLTSFLKGKFSNEIKSEQLTLINEDILKFEISSCKLLAASYKLIANIPYNITGAILEKYLSQKNQPTQMVVLVQKEVAERVVARDKKESILSLAVKAYGNPKIVSRVKRGSFNPIPNVDSAVLSIENISRKNFINDRHEKMFFKLIKSGFAHKRKFLISNIREAFPSVNFTLLFKEQNLSEKVRAEDVSLVNWITLSEKITKL